MSETVKSLEDEAPAGEAFESGVPAGESPEAAAGEAGKDADGRCVDEEGEHPQGCDGHGGCGGQSGCGSHEQTTPLFDARSIDPRIRQSAIFGVLMGLPPGEAVTVVTPGDPTPIADLLNERLPGQYEATAAELEDGIFLVTFERLA